MSGSSLFFFPCESVQTRRQNFYYLPRLGNKYRTLLTLGRKNARGDAVWFQQAQGTRLGGGD